jgi:hypothetical protein
MAVGRCDKGTQIYDSYHKALIERVQTDVAKSLPGPDFIPRDDVFKKALEEYKQAEAKYIAHLLICSQCREYIALAPRSQEREANASPPGV